MSAKSASISEWNAFYQLVRGNQFPDQRVSHDRESLVRNIGYSKNFASCTLEWIIVLFAIEMMSIGTSHTRQWGSGPHIDPVITFIHRIPASWIYLWSQIDP